MKKGKKIDTYCKKYFPKEVSERVLNDLDKIVIKQEKEIKKSKNKIIRNIKINFDDSIPLINALRTL